MDFIMSYVFQRGDHSDVLHLIEGLALVMLCSCRQAPRRLSVLLLKEVKLLAVALIDHDPLNDRMIDIMDT